MKRKLSSLLSIALALQFTGQVLNADDNSAGLDESKSILKTTSKRLSKPATADTKSVEMFEAMAQGLVSVDYIGRNATEANLIFRNKGNEPLNIVLPATFGAVPVLAQGFGGG